MTVSKSIPSDLIDALLSGYQKPEDLMGENGLLKQLTKAVVERALEAEMAEHPGHSKHESVIHPGGNTRNGKSKKTLKSEFGELPIEIPRDRHGSFEPPLIPKHQTRWTSFDDNIISLFARGMMVREIQSHLTEMYGAEVSPTLISSVTDAVNDGVKAWQSRQSPRYRRRACQRPLFGRWVVIWLGKKKCWVYGSLKPKALNSGYQSLPNSYPLGHKRIAAYRTSLLPVSMD